MVREGSRQLSVASAAAQLAAALEGARAMGSQRRESAACKQTAATQSLGRGFGAGARTSGTNQPIKYRRAALRQLSSSLSSYPQQGSNAPLVAAAAAEVAGRGFLLTQSRSTSHRRCWCAAWWLTTCVRLRAAHVLP